MRDHLAHRYFDTSHSILQATVDDDLPELECAIHALAQTLPDEDHPDGDASRENSLGEDPDGEQPPANSPSQA